MPIPPKTIPPGHKVFVHPPSPEPIWHTPPAAKAFHALELQRRKNEDAKNGDWT